MCLGLCEQYHTELRGVYFQAQLERCTARCH